MATTSGRSHSERPDGENPIVIVSNRGPVAYESVDGTVIANRGGGGLVSGLAPLVTSGRAQWVAAAMSDTDRAVASGAVSPATQPDDLNVDLLALDPEDQRLYYDEISNGTLWFAHHGLFDLVRSPSYLDDWWDAWGAYRRVNRVFAERVAELAPPGATVLIQDYHLTLLPQTLTTDRPDLTLVHFHHTPFAGPDGLRVLPDEARDEMLTSLLAHHAIGFHTQDWVRNFRASAAQFLGSGDTDRFDSPARSIGAGQVSGGSAIPRLFAATLSSDIKDIASAAASPECAGEMRRIDELLAGRKLLARVDRMELSKNIVRGFQAFDLLLQRRTDLRSEVTFLACCYPSRENIPEYALYRDEVIEAARRVNERWATKDWTPIELQVDDNFARSVAVLRRYDVLLVNPIRDGLNLVAKEGPSVNEREGRLVLSTQAGAWTEVGAAAIGVNPFDVAATANALEIALDMNEDECRRRSAQLAELAGLRTPGDWLDDQLAAAASNQP